MASLAKRFGFRRTSIPQAGEIPSESLVSISHSGASTEKENGVSTAHRIAASNTLEAQRKLKDLARKHRWDPNLPSDTLEDLDEATYRGNLPYDLNVVNAFEENSPYPEVRAAVRNVSKKF